MATPINVAVGISIAIASPLPGLASAATAPTAQTISAGTASVAPAPAAPMFGPTATGPSTTLSPLMNDAETAVAAASQVARPTPGRSDRISDVVVEAPEIVPIPHLAPAEAEGVPVVPGPEIQAERPAPEAVPEVPAPAPDLPAIPATPAPIPEAAPEDVREPMALDAWDAAIGLVATDPQQPEAELGSPSHRVEGLAAAGIAVVAWGGWKVRSRAETRSRRRSLPAGPRNS